MAKVEDIASYILEVHGSMSAMKLQKLVFYSQAWSIALRRQPLFDSPIQAWTYGPVVPALYKLHRGKFVIGQISGDSKALTSSERILVTTVAEHYGRFDGEQLSQMTHSEGPWIEARRGAPSDEPAATEISPTAMREFYKAPPFKWSGTPHQ